MSSISKYNSNSWGGTITQNKIGFQDPHNYNEIYVNFEALRFEYKQNSATNLESWHSKIISHVNLHKNILDHISVFFDKYSKIESDIFTIKDFNGNKIYPKDYINFSDAEKLIFDDIKKFITNDSDTKLNIVSEYYNSITCKRGLLLENNIRVEDGKFLDQKHQEKVDNAIKSIIDKRIEYILNPDKRKFLQREDKIKRVLGFKNKDI